MAHLYFVSIHPFGRQRAHRARARREVARAEPRPADPDRARLHDRARAQGLTTTALERNNKDTRHHGLARLFRKNCSGSAAQHDPAR